MGIIVPSTAVTKNLSWSSGEAVPLGVVTVAFGVVAFGVACKAGGIFWEDDAPAAGLTAVANAAAFDPGWTKATSAGGLLVLSVPNAFGAAEVVRARFCSGLRGRRLPLLRLALSVVWRRLLVLELLELEVELLLLRCFLSLVARRWDRPRLSALRW